MEDIYYDDLYRDLTTNPEFCSKAMKILGVIEKAYKDGDTETARKGVHELLALCNYNPSLLVPYFFPRFPESEPMTLWSRPHSFAMMGLTFLGDTTIKASRQIGKCLIGPTHLKIKENGVTRITTIKDLFDNCKKSVDAGT